MDFVTATVMVPAEISIPIMGVCKGGCDHNIVTRRRWKAMTKEVRRQLKGLFREECAKGLCHPCHTKASREGRLADFEARFVPGDVFADEYNLMRRQGMTDYDVRLALKMTVHAFEKALIRNADKITEPRSRERITPQTYDDGSFGKRTA